MYDINKVIVSGRIANDPKLEDKPTKAGGHFSLLNLTLANNYGKDENSTSFFFVSVTGKQAENIAKFLSKGLYVIVEGRIEQQTWEKEGQKHSKVVIKSDRIKVTPKKNDFGNSEDNNNDGDVPF